MSEQGMPSDKDLRESRTFVRTWYDFGQNFEGRPWLCPNMVCLRTKLCEKAVVMSEQGMTSDKICVKVSATF